MSSSFTDFTKKEDFLDGEKIRKKEIVNYFFVLEKA